MAVAIKRHGYTNIKIYNGGIKEWVGAGLQTVAVDPLPAYDTQFVSSAELKAKLDMAESSGCRSAAGKPLLTLLDLRTERIPEGGVSPLIIQSSCPTVSGSLDNLQYNHFRVRIPRDIPVHVITETGNRDVYAARYLSSHGYSNIFGLEFGMRGWLKADYPTITVAEQ